MTVYAVMRGSQTVALFATEKAAQQVADKANAEFPKGKRYEVVPLPVREE